MGSGSKASKTSAIGRRSDASTAAIACSTGKGGTASVSFASSWHAS